MWCNRTLPRSNGSRGFLHHGRPPQHIQTRAYAAASPRVRAARRQQALVPKLRQQTPEVKGLLKWPFDMINAACNANKIPIAPAVAIAVLDGFQELAQKSNWDQTNAKKLMQEHHMQPETLTTLAQILLRVSGPSSQEFALSLLLTASKLEDADATMMLVDQTLKSGRAERLRNPKLRDTLKHLVKLEDGGHSAATVLLAQVTELEGNYEKALSMLRSVVEQSSSDNPQTTKEADKALRSVLSEAWASIARLEGKLGNSIEKEKALEAAARLYDHPQAFYELTLLMDDKSSPQYTEYLQKAAISGVGDAAYHLGLLYSSEVEAKQDQIHATISNALVRVGLAQARELAKEWLSIASESSDCTRPGAAKLLLAWAFRGMGELEKSKALLDQACNQLALNAERRGSLTQHWTDLRLVRLSEELDNLARTS